MSDQGEEPPTSLPVPLTHCEPPPGAETRFVPVQSGAQLTVPASLLYVFVSVFMPVSAGAHMLRHTCGGQGTTSGVGSHRPPCFRHGLLFTAARLG